MIVTQDMDGVRKAALELMEESLREEDTARVVDNLNGQEATPETVAKAVPLRELADGFYDYAGYLMWLRGMLDSDVDLVVLADEADGLRAVQAARYEFERKHPACPKCGVRQYSVKPMRCRNRACGMDFTKARAS